MGRGTVDRQRAQEHGRLAELCVAEHLEAVGWTVEARNWRCAAGEVDLIVRRGGALRFVEVKARTPGDDSSLEAVGPAKQRRLSGAARTYLDDYRRPWDEAAFMVAVVTLGDDPWVVELLDDAFDAC